MKFLFDNDLPFPIARALRILSQPVQHVRDIPDLGPSAPDDLNLDYASRRGFYLVTKDKAIKRTPQYRAIIAEARIGAFLHQHRQSTPIERMGNGETPDQGVG